MINPGDISECAFCGMGIVCEKVNMTQARGFNGIISNAIWVDTYGHNFHMDVKGNKSFHYAPEQYGQAPYEYDITIDEQNRVRKSLEEMAKRNK